MKPVFYFSDEYLDRCKKLTTEQIAIFLDDFRVLHSTPPSVENKSIHVRTSKELKRAFRTKCDLEGVKHQTQIKKLMSDWLGVVK